MATDPYLDELPDDPEAIARFRERQRLALMGHPGLRPAASKPWDVEEDWGDAGRGRDLPSAEFKERQRLALMGHPGLRPKTIANPELEQDWGDAGARARSTNATTSGLEQDWMDAGAGLPRAAAKRPVAPKAPSAIVGKSVSSTEDDDFLKSLVAGAAPIQSPVRAVRVPLVATSSSEQEVADTSSATSSDGPDVSGIYRQATLDELENVGRSLRGEAPLRVAPKMQAREEIKSWLEKKRHAEERAKERAREDKLKFMQMALEGRKAEQASKTQYDIASLREKGAAERASAAEKLRLEEAERRRKFESEESAKGRAHQSALQRQRLDHEADLKARYEKVAPGKDDDKARKETWKEASSLRKEFNTLPQVKRFGIIDSSYRKIQSLADDSSAMGDLALVFEYMRVLDPDSTVREREAASVENARGVPEGIRNTYNKLLKGEILTQAQRQDLRRQAGTVHSAQKAAFHEQAKRYRTLADKSGVDPDDVTGDLSIYGVSDTAAPEPQKQGITEGLITVIHYGRRLQVTPSEYRVLKDSGEPVTLLKE